MNIKNLLSNCLVKILIALASLMTLSLSPTQAAADAFDASAQSRSSISTFVGNSMLMKLDNPVSRVAVGDPNIADFRIISPLELLILGKSAGSTNIILWHKNGKSTIIDTSVSMDLSSLKKVLEAEFPKETDIHLNSTPGSIVLSGSVSDVSVANAAVILSEAHARNFAATTKAPSVAQVVNLIKIRDIVRKEDLEINQKIIIHEIRGMTDGQQNVKYLQQGAGEK